MKIKISMNLPIVYHPNYVVPLPEYHRFPMAKFSLLHQMLIADGVAEPGQFHAPTFPAKEWICQVHHSDYVQAYCSGTLDQKAQRRIGLPWSAALADRTCIAVAGTILTAELALKTGLACNTAGGTHHAFPSFGSGFCIFNDMAIAARILQQLGQVKKVLIVDRRGNYSGDRATFGGHYARPAAGVSSQVVRPIFIPIYCGDRD